MVQEDGSGGIQRIFRQSSRELKRFEVRIFESGGLIDFNGAG